MKDIKISKDTVEKDIVIKLPNKKTITLQYRNYNDIPTVDVILSNKTHAYNWEGREMKPAKTAFKKRHIHVVDQICLTI